MKTFVLFTIIFSLLPANLAYTKLKNAKEKNRAKAPPMGWMSWEVFSCDVDCDKFPNSCIGEKLFKRQTDALVETGLVKAGYRTISIDDCWESKERTATGELKPNSTRFPSGLKALGDYMHSKNVKFGLYTDEGTATCQGYPGSKGFEERDISTFANWGVDYLKVDGCNNVLDDYERGYKAIGRAISKSSRDITFSCSWPAYVQVPSEAEKPFKKILDAGCDLWRSFDDMQCNWNSLKSVINYYGDNSDFIATLTGSGQYNDPDMLLTGNGCITIGEERIQLAVWGILAAPLIMGNDVTNIKKESLSLLLNEQMIAINQDFNRKAGTRYSTTGNTDIWVRHLHGNDLALALVNKGEEDADIGFDLQNDFDWHDPTSMMVMVMNIFEGTHTIDHLRTMTFKVPARDVTYLRVLFV